MNEMNVEPERLKQMAGKLRSSTSGLEGAAESMPPPPEVTITSDKVGYTLSEITKTAAAVAAGAQDIAGKIDASDSSYAEVDNRNADGFDQLPKFTR